jgi:hypothetical protein
MNSDVIDMHVHFGAPKDEESGCYWSKEFEQTLAYLAMLLLTKSLFKKIDISRVKKHLLGTINGAKYVAKCVLLAMDQVYDEKGRVHPEWTHLHVPNRYLASLAIENERVLFGASVHPYRVDWEDELSFCFEQKAVLCKWITSSQQINPAHSKCEPFYKMLAAHKLPLLCHGGPEYAIPTSNKIYNEYNNPKHLTSALEQGVTVIVAHSALPYFWLADVNYQDDFKDLLKLFHQAEKENWNLYADVSAITGPLRMPYIERLRKEVPPERLLFGSDYPIPLSELSYNRSTGFFSWLGFICKVIFMKNPLDKNYLIVKEMGFDKRLFTNAQMLFSSIEYPAT